MKTKTMSIALAMLMIFSALTVIVPVYAKTKEEAIADGMVWLASQQNPVDGSWGASVGRTGLAVLKFETYAIENNIDPLHQTYTYYPQVRGGLDYIFANAHIQAIGLQPYGDPDTDGDGTGVYFGTAPTYETGIAMMAIAASTHPGMVVTVPGAVNGWKYKHVVEDAVDYLAFGQNDAGWARGGWGYSHNTGGSDNSNTGYAVLGLGYARALPPGGFGLTIPAFVYNELDVWIEYIQNKDGSNISPWGWPALPDPIGGSGYQDPWGWVNILKTGNLLYEMWFVGDETTTPRVMAAIDYLVRHWGDADDDPGWRGFPGGSASYQAMYCVMKGLEAFGIHEIDGIDWQADFEEVLIDQQLDGSWPPCYWGDSILATEWALLTLEKAVPPPPPPTLEDIEEKLDFWLPEIKHEIVMIEEKLDFWLPEIKHEIVMIEEKLDFWLPEIKTEIEHIEWKLDYTIDKEAVEVEILTGKEVGIGTQILKGKFVYYMMTTVAGQKVNYTSIEIEAEAMTIDPADYTVTGLKTGVYKIEIDRHAVPQGTKLIVIQVQYVDASGVVYHGAAITTAFTVGS